MPYNQVMEFNSLFFIFMFMPIFIGLMFFIKNNKARNLILLLFSLIFYYFGSPKYLLLLLIVSFVTYLFGYKVKANGKIYAIFLISIITMLSYFKYGQFVLDSLDGFVKTGNLSKIIMPLGVSFYTFTAISYVSDIYYEKYEHETNYLRVLTFLSFFPTVISGPLIRFDSFKKYLDEKKITTDSIANGLRRFAVGLGKKVIIANQLSLVTELLFSEDTKLTAALAFFALVAYLIQEYYDFSGYSDMAIGIGYMIGYEIPENFDNPLISRSLAEYWRRWHISLGAWFKDYVFNPVLASKWLQKLGSSFKDKKTGRAIVKIVALAINWLLTGVWHGNRWNYILWGVYNGVIIIFDALNAKNFKKWIQKFHINSESKLWIAFQLVRTYILLLIKAFLFKCESLSLMKKFLKAFIGVNGMLNYPYIQSLNILYLLFYLVIGIVLVIPAVQNCLKRINEKFGFVYDLSLVAIFAVSVFFIVSGSYSAFIYFSF